MINLDEFKKLNDRFGDLAGDETLRASPNACDKPYVRANGGAALAGTSS